MTGSTGPGGARGRLDGLLTRAALTHPERPALVDGDRAWTYAELDAAVGDLADGLAAHGVEPGDRVGVFIPKSADAVLAIHAALRAGAVVAPLDTRNPAARTRRMMRQAGLTALLATDASRPGAVEAASDTAEPRTEVLAGGVELLRVRDAPPAGPLPEAACEGGYVLFTSGSTGTPKGVLLSHGNVTHFAEWAAAETGLRPTDRIGSQAALTFDLSTFDLFSAAAAGACTVLMPERLKAFPADVVDWLGTRRISVLYAVPSLYVGLLERGGIAEASLAALRVLLYAGEPFPPAALERYLRLAGDRPVYNLYGPTETNVCTYLRVPGTWTAAQPATVGRAVPGDTVEVFDEHGRPTSGQGEIHVAGATVFLGYLQDGALVDPARQVRFRDGVVRRAYPTGDLGRCTDDGEFVLLGRKDVQVKRHGYRIDPGEIESVLCDAPGVKAAAVVAKGGAHEGELWAYVQGTLPEREALMLLRTELPLYMVPDRVVTVAALPLNDRGKTDRPALAARSWTDLPQPAPDSPALKETG
ncbi:MULTISPECIES: amino acid adenylation domain-containing protein [Streptomyces]|uniref:amino acid adenylation domain-containing protein n=1 Tax=Streptomyces TaxID=1883 RepID=UPI001E570F2F|nr:MULTISPECIES: amino acid adenylation domain-containing protein [Streptomyces]UFQ17176.1 amino acid adenylation domain-containing protein [Streptomyces huasconensis]WCL86776.1 amino acid adenylation domain-containing protein [Streptomyces sp. JCM 35825]